MSARPLVLFHDHCPDGFAASWVASRALGRDADFLAVNYGQPPPDVTGRDCFILDFSYKRSILLDMAAKARRIVVLDHHKTAAAELGGDALKKHAWYDADAQEHHSIECTFDLAKCGARLAWEHFFPQDPTAPWIVNRVEDRDLWKWELPHGKEISAWFASVPWTFDLLDELYPEPAASVEEDLIRQGVAILRYQAQLVDGAAKNAVETTLDGHRVLAVNATCLMSEIGERLAQGRPFGATWFARSDGKKVWSLRSRAGGIDVSEVAKRHGGGGHAQAAGFEE